MANREQRRAAQKSGLPRIMQSLSDAAQKASESSPEENDLDDDESDGPAGQLPLPVSQEVEDDRFSWVWEPIPELVHVRVIYWKTTQEWGVNLYQLGTCCRYDTEQSKLIAEALLAAYNWQFAWKIHMADYMLTPGEVPKPLETVSDSLKKDEARFDYKPVEYPENEHG